MNKMKTLKLKDLKPFAKVFPQIFKITTKQDNYWQTREGIKEDAMYGETL